MGRTSKMTKRSTRKDSQNSEGSVPRSQQSPKMASETQTFGDIMERVPHHGA